MTVIRNDLNQIWKCAFFNKKKGREWEELGFDFVKFLCNLLPIMCSFNVRNQLCLKGEEKVEEEEEEEEGKRAEAALDCEPEHLSHQRTWQEYSCI